MRECPLGQVCRNYRARPPTPTGETVKTIPLGDGFYAYVDAADYEWLSRWTWHLCGGYAVRSEKRRLVFMHREIVHAPRGKPVDHINRNKLDNTRLNLWICTPVENARNRSKRRGTFSRFRGVSYNKDHAKWFARIGFKGRCIHLGYFTDEVEAARAYDRKAVELFGATAHLNFPEEWPARRRRAVRAGRASRKKACGRKTARRSSCGKAVCGPSAHSKRTKET
jgi:hypothetical protein